ncbi:hypothetical protein ABIF63_003568 [Bradyrhizobium japonicum]|uniref:Uncharacterized protein n=1 Tax=Bradyrhizobium japonicum TaxID=375 RepID=A0ABV2RR73_BRAJP|nr:hypothetical protein [Bradyrhizobium japonicum]UQD97195.1 hypothetical protein JEY30_37795 [Bradyrhizobium japonicum]WLB17306.1 hypothetical protein QIH95_35675 [Bradyrhizobium japonicum]
MTAGASEASVNCAPYSLIESHGRFKLFERDAQRNQSSKEAIRQLDTARRDDERLNSPPRLHARSHAMIARIARDFDDQVSRKSACDLGVSLIRAANAFSEPTYRTLTAKMQK